MYVDRSGQEPILSRDQFELVGRKRGKTASVITRAWGDTVDTAGWAQVRHHSASAPRRPEPRSTTEVPLNDVLAALRHVESGQAPRPFLGATAWNIVAEMNNQDVSPNDPDYLIPWQEWIHRDFRNGTERRARAAGRLAEAYGQLAEIDVPELPRRRAD
jgi:hypothetical protein